MLFYSYSIPSLRFPFILKICWKVQLSCDSICYWDFVFNCSVLSNNRLCCIQHLPRQVCLPHIVFLLVLWCSGIDRVRFRDFTLPPKIKFAELQLHVVISMKKSEYLTQSYDAVQSYKVKIKITEENYPFLSCFQVER